MPIAKDNDQYPPSPMRSNNQRFGVLATNPGRAVADCEDDIETWSEKSKNVQEY